MVRLFFIALLSAVLISCDSPLGLSTLDSEIQGKVIFINPELKPDYVEAVRIVAAVQIPPQSLGDVIFTYSGVDLASERSDYRIPAPPAEYQLVAAVWKQKGKAWNYANILGFYGFDPVTYDFEYIPVHVRENTLSQNIDIYCDWTLAYTADAGAGD